MSNFVSADAEGDLEHLGIRNFLTQCCIETRAALLDVPKVEGGDVRDRLNVLVTGKVGIWSAVEIVVVSRNSRDVLEGERLRKARAEVWIGSAAVANVPASVYVEMHDVGKAR